VILGAEMPCLPFAGSDPDLVALTPRERKDVERPVIAEVLGLHREVQALLRSGKQRLRQTRELLRIDSGLLAHACVLLGDLGRDQAARDYGTAALLFAQEAEADEGIAWSVKSKTARWQNRFVESAELARRGFEVSGPTPTKVELAYREAIAIALNAVCWHLLVGDQPSARELSREARRRLAGFTGLHMTPERWLHMTVLLAGSVGEITQDSMNEMIATATLALSGVPPVNVKFGRVIYHPEAIVLDASPAAALDPVFAAAQAATRTVTSAAAEILTPWRPHLTLCYSTSEQPAPPIIAALGRELPACEVTIDKLSLVIQRGPELLWDWHPVGAANLLGPRER
jgi:2'-5' RNA ligase